VLGELSALLDRLNFPEALPEAFGLNRTATWMFWPAAMVSGKPSPGSVNSDYSPALKRWSLKPFEAESVSRRLAWDPTTTLPKSRLEGETPRVADCTAPPVPTPQSQLGIQGILMRVIVPVVFPAAKGLNLMVN